MNNFMNDSQEKHKQENLETFGVHYDPTNPDEIKIFVNQRVRRVERVSKHDDEVLELVIEKKEKEQ